MTDNLNTPQTTLDPNLWLTYERIESIQRGQSKNYHAMASLLPSGWYVVNIKDAHAIRFATKDAIASFVAHHERSGDPLADYELIVAVEPIVVHKDDIV